MRSCMAPSWHRDHRDGGVGYGPAPCESLYQRFSRAALPRCAPIISVVITVALPDHPLGRPPPPTHRGERVRRPYPHARDRGLHQGDPSVFHRAIRSIGTAALAVTPLALPAAAPAAVAAPLLNAPMQHAHGSQPLFLHTHGTNATTTSTNWAGYAAHGSTYTSVSASWVQP